MDVRDMGRQGLCVVLIVVLIQADCGVVCTATMEEMQTWYFSHPASVSSTVDVPDFRNYGHGPYHGRVGPYPYATHPHAPAAPPQPTRPQYDKVPSPALECLLNEQPVCVLL